jgi:hypothetical protein
VDTIHAGDLIPRRTIATFERYTDAQSLVSRLSDDEFPLDRFVIGVVAGGLIRLFIDPLSDRRSFASAIEVQSTRYEVMADEEAADEALRRLGPSTAQSNVLEQAPSAR